MKLKLVVFQILLFSLFSSFGQTAPIKDIHIVLASSNTPIATSDSLLLVNTLTVDSLLTDFYENSTFDVGVSVLLSDTVNISKIYVKLGRTEGGTELFDSFFLFDKSVQSHGVSFTRDRYYVVMELGQFTDVNELYCEVFTIKPNTAATAPFKMSIKNK